MRYETDRSLLIKYRMNLNRHWFDWKNHDFSFEGDIWFIMVYQVITEEEVMNEKYINEIFSFFTILFKISYDLIIFLLL